MCAFAQAQIGNSNFEQWEPVVTGQEPVNWNSFLSGTGNFAPFAADQCQPSTDVRPGSLGIKSCRINSREAFSIIANGNLTLGQINMGSTTPASPQNYNFSKTSDANHSEALTDHPDSLVFWAKFAPVVSAGNLAKVKATLHTNYDYRDPEDASSSSEVIGTAQQTFAATGGWVRFSIPFDYSGPACINDQAFILITFTTNMNPGGGSADDLLFIDDLELIYSSTDRDFDGDGITDETEANDGTDPCDFCDFVLANATVAPSPEWEAADCDQDGMNNGWELVLGSDPLTVSLTELNKNDLNVAMNNAKGIIVVQSTQPLDGAYEVLNLMGQKVQGGALASEIPFDQPTGMYIVRIERNGAVQSFEIVRL
jgi:hypothetical protein